MNKQKTLFHCMVRTLIKVSIVNRGKHILRYSIETLFLCAVSFLLFYAHTNAAGIVRFPEPINPIIRPGAAPGPGIMVGPDGDNITGPSLIQTPDWLPGKLGKYYLYFTSHHGRYIRMAYANNLEGPWTIYAPGTGTLSADDVKAVAGSAQGVEVNAPDVHVDHVNLKIRMYFGTNHPAWGHVSAVATSNNGLNFTVVPNPLLPNPYPRVWQWNGSYYAIDRFGVIYQSSDSISGFTKIPNVGGYCALYSSREFTTLCPSGNPNGQQSIYRQGRHSAVAINGNTLTLFFTKIADAPEHIKIATITLAPNPANWTIGPATMLLEPGTIYEGIDLPIEPSTPGPAHVRVRQLRDPYLYKEGTKQYLLYAGAGEDVIAIGEYFEGTVPPSVLACSPPTQTSIRGQSAFFGASGGTGTYAWSAPGGTTTSGSGTTFSTQYTTTGSKTVTVTSGPETKTCAVTVIENPPLACSPATQTTSPGTNISVNASGATGTYAWSASGAVITSGSGATFTTKYTYKGTKTITVTSGTETKTCTVEVISATSGGSDIIGPGFDILLPHKDSTVSGVFEILASASDTSGVAKLELYLEDELIQTITEPITPGSPTYRFLWNTASVPDGGYRIKVIAKDGALDASGAPKFNESGEGRIITVVNGILGPPAPPTPFTTAPPTGDLKPGGLLSFPEPMLGPNLLESRNGNFDSVDADGKPTFWDIVIRKDTLPGDGVTIDSGVALSGKSLRIRNAIDTLILDKATQTIRLKKGTYRVTGWIKMDHVGDISKREEEGGMRFGFSPSPYTGGFSAPLLGTGNWQYVEERDIVVTPPEGSPDVNVLISVISYKEPSGTAWFDNIEVREQLPFPVDVFMMYPNFRGMLFDDQSQTMKFDVQINPPVGTTLSEYILVGTLKDDITGAIIGAPVTIVPGTTSHHIVTFNGTSLVNDRTYLATFQLKRAAGGALVYEYPAYRVSKVAGSKRNQMAVSVNEHNILLFYNKPTFGRGVYDSGIGRGTTEQGWWNNAFAPIREDNRYTSRRVTDLPINMYLNYWFGRAPADSMNAMKNVLWNPSGTWPHNNKIMTFHNHNCFASRFNFRDFSYVTNREYLKTIVPHVGNGGFYLYDECGSHLASEMFVQAQHARDIDRDGIIFGSINSQKKGRYWRDIGEFYSMHDYPMWGPESGYDGGIYPFEQAGDIIARAKEATMGSRPLGSVIQFYQTQSLARWPTQAELRNMSYMAITEGANGLWYWSIGAGALGYQTKCLDEEKDANFGWCLSRIEKHDSLKAVLTELEDLETRGALITPDRPELLISNSNPSIRTRVKFADAKGYLFTYNHTNTNQTSTFTWSGSPTGVSVYNEGRMLAGSSTFTDSYGPYQAHVYVVSMSVDGIFPTVSITAPTSGATISGTVTISANASDDTGIAGVQFKVDGTNIGAEDQTVLYSLSWDSKTVANGPHTLTAVARDLSGNTTTSAPVSIIVNNLIPPLLPVISGVTASAITTTSARITWTTDIPSDSQVEYGQTPNGGITTPLDPALVTSHSVTLTGLSSGTTYHYLVLSGGTMSIDFTFTTLADSTPDTIPPGPISDLRITRTELTSLNLSWTAPGDDGSIGTAASYQMRFALNPITEETWATATLLPGLPLPFPAGTTQTYTAIGLLPDTTYYIAMKTSDEVPNLSLISNVINAKTLSVPPGVPPGSILDTTPTGPVIPLRAVGADKQVFLEWKNPTDTDFARTYIVQKKGSEPSSRTDGTIIYEGTGTLFTATGLENGQTYYFAFVALDRAGNHSRPIIEKAIPKAGIESIPKVAGTGSGRERSYPSGTLLRYVGDPHVYLIMEGKRHHVPDFATLRRLTGGDLSRVILVFSADILSVYEVGEPVKFSEATVTQPILWKTPSKPEVYVVDHDSKEKRHIPSLAVFYSYGFSFSKVAVVEQTALDQYTTGEPLTFQAVSSGTLLRASDNPRVYVIQDDKKRWIPSLSVFQAHGLRFVDVRVVSPDLLGAYQDGSDVTSTEVIPRLAPPEASTYPSGSLVKGPGPTVYFIESGQKRPFQSLTVFDFLGYKRSRIKQVSTQELDAFPTGGMLLAIARHPNGTLVRLGDDIKVYLLEGAKLRYIPSITVFQSKGFRFDDVVTITTQEFQGYEIGESLQ